MKPCDKGNPLAWARISSLQSSAEWEVKAGMGDEGLQCESAKQKWFCCFLWSFCILVWDSVCVYISSFLTHRAISLHPPPSAACSPSLIFPLSQHNSGDQSLVAMAIKPPMQVCVCVCVCLRVCVRACRNNSCVQCAAHTDCTCLSAVRATRPPPVMPLSAMPSRSEWLWQLSSQDALTCHTWIPFSSVQNNDQIQRKGKERNKNHTHAALSGLFCFRLVKGTALHDGRLLKFFLNSGGTAAEEPIIRRNNNIFCLCLPRSFVWRFLPKGSSLIVHSSCVARENDQRIIYMSRTDLVWGETGSFFFFRHPFILF